MFNIMKHDVFGTEHELSWTISVGIQQNEEVPLTENEKFVLRPSSPFVANSITEAQLTDTNPLIWKGELPFSQVRLEGVESLAIKHTAVRKPDPSKQLKSPLIHVQTAQYILEQTLLEYLTCVVTRLAHISVFSTERKIPKWGLPLCVYLASYSSDDFEVCFCCVGKGFGVKA